MGCGEGSILKHLDSHGFGPEMHVVDISESGVRAVMARQLPSLQSLRVFDGYRTGFADRSFDLAFCSRVLEHVEFERLLLRELARLSDRIDNEVPIDFSPQADDRAAQLLSYGHINMYSPTAVRCRLKTEGPMVLDDLLAVTAPELSCYNDFRNQKKEAATDDNIGRKTTEWRATVAAFRAKDRRAQEASASACVVLVDTTQAGLKIFK